MCVPAPSCSFPRQALVIIPGRIAYYSQLKDSITEAVASWNMQLPTRTCWCRAWGLGHTTLYCSTCIIMRGPISCHHVHVHPLFLVIMRAEQALHYSVVAIEIST